MSEVFQRYGIKLGRLWIRYPEFAPRKFCIGVHVEEQWWEMGEKHSAVEVFLLPMVGILLQWTWKDRT